MTTQTVLLLGQQRFQVQWQWLSSEQVVGISSVAIDNEGQVVVACRQAPHIRIFSVDALPVHTFSIPDLICPHHISIDAQNRLWVTDLDGHQVFALSLEGRVLHRLGHSQQPKWQAPFNHPTHALLLDDELWVSDGYGNACVHRFDRQLNLISSFGQPGAGLGQFSVPHMLAAAQGRVYVADRENSRVQAFDVKQAQHCFTLEPMYKPMAIYPYADKGLLVSDQTAALSLFSYEGAILGRCRVNAVYGHGMAADEQGRIFISTMLPDGLACLSPL